MYAKYNSPYKLYMVFGKKGSGKSTYLCKLACAYLKKGYNVYTNMQEMRIAGVRFICDKDVGEYIPESNSCLLLDEVGILYDNRKFKNFTDEQRDFYKLQRHYKTVVYLSSQTFDVDKKLRDLTDKMYLVTSVTSYLSIIRPISKRITLVEASAQGESKITDNLKFDSIFSYKYLFIPKYSKYFDSFKAPEKPFIPYQEICIDGGTTGHLEFNIRRRAVAARASVGRAMKKVGICICEILEKIRKTLRRIKTKRKEK